MVTTPPPDRFPGCPPFPAGLKVREEFASYLNARADLITALVVDVREQATQYTPATAPLWAAHLMDPHHQRLLGDLAVWRAATGVPPDDRRLTGKPQLGAAPERAQHDLDSRVADVLVDPRAPARQWAPLDARLGLDVRHDPYWPELADRLSSLRRAGLDVAGMVTAAALEKPLPDEQCAAALWWRLSRHLTSLTRDPSQIGNEAEAALADARPTHSAGDRIALAQKEIRPSPRQPRCRSR